MLTGALAFIAVACATNDDEPIVRSFDPCTLVVAPEAELEAHELASIQEAIDMWHSAAGTRATVGKESDEARRLEVRFDDAPAAFRGLYDDERGIVFINRDLPSARARSITVAHELGHAFGLLHVDPDERTSLMNPDNVDVPPTPDDARAVHALWGRCADR